jgi:hypothetical protein
VTGVNIVFNSSPLIFLARLSSRTKENGTVSSFVNHPQTLTVPCSPFPVPSSQPLTLIVSTHLEVLDKLAEYPDNFYLPKSVADEIEAKQDQPRADIASLIDSGQIEVREVTLLSLATSLNKRLGKGESDAIALSIQLQADYTILETHIQLYWQKH